MRTGHFSSNRRYPLYTGLTVQHFLFITFVIDLEIVARANRLVVDSVFNILLLSMIIPVHKWFRDIFTEN